MKTILVALDLSQSDIALIKLSLDLALRLEVTTLEFIHVVPRFLFSDEIEESSRNIISPGFGIDKVLINEISSNIELELKGQPSQEYHIVVKQGLPAETIMAYVASRNPDILIIGNKKTSEGSGVVSKLLARQVVCSVLFVPDSPNGLPHNILVPIDLNGDTSKALDMSISLMSEKHETSIKVLFVAEYPPSTQLFASTYGLLSPNWENIVDSSFDNLMKQKGLPTNLFEFTAIRNDYFDVALHIKEFAEEKQNDFIILNAPSQTDITELFLGNLIENLVESVKNLPIMVIR